MDSETSSLENSRVEPDAELDRTPLPGGHYLELPRPVANVLCLATDENSTPPPLDLSDPDPAAVPSSETTNGKVEEEQEEQNTVCYHNTGCAVIGAWCALFGTFDRVLNPTPST